MGELVLVELAIHPPPLFIVPAFMGRRGCVIVKL